MYYSFLICEHEKLVNFYSEGLPVATYHKDTGQFECHTKNEGLYKKAQESFHAASLTLSLNNKFE